jgi:YidC/Oxa1 family membrane protein insertase
MTDMRRTILWVVFSVSLFLLWDAWNKHNGHGSIFAPAPPKPVAAGSAPQGASAALPTPAAAAGTTAASAAATATAAKSELVTVTTDVMKATFDTRGGDLVRLVLLHYADAEDPHRDVVLFDRSPKLVYLAQTGLVSAQPGVELPNHLTLMSVAPGKRTLEPGMNELQLRFESPDVDGTRLVKTYSFRRGQYTIGVTHEFHNGTSAPIAPELYLQLARDETEVGHPGMFMGPTSYTGPAIYTDAGKFQKIDFKSIDKGNPEYQKSADNGWVAMVQHYFASAWLVNAKAPREFKVDRIPPNENTFGHSLYRVAMVLPLGEVAPGATYRQEATLFAGPEEEKKLEALAPGLDLVKDYGWLTILAKPLFWLLYHLHGFLGNWGWSIVALVVLLKIAFFGLNAHAYRSMAKMKAINPRLMALRERLKDNPQQMQQEMMRIYREEKVNPLGGCLPILVQMPFFIALYWVLLSSVEMRNAPWIGWITDLSSKDPYYILPLLMTGSTLFQTWLNPTPPDPVQARMMWIMPLVFSVMFFVFPAGLVLYWLTNNLLGIAQQWLINRKLGVSK